MIASADDIEVGLAAGRLLLHGLSIDALLSVVRDGQFDTRYKADDFAMGISLTRSFRIASEHASSQEQHFDTVLESYYGLQPSHFESRVGAVMVFERSLLQDLQMEHVDYLGDGLFDEQEERVIGTFDRITPRLAGVACVLEELDWYETFAIAGMEEGEAVAGELAQALKVVRSLAVPIKPPTVPEWLLRA